MKAISNKALRSHVYMSAKDGQTAGLNGLKCFKETHGYSRGNIE